MNLNVEQHRKTTTSAAAAILAGTPPFREEDIDITADLALDVTSKDTGFYFLLFGPSVREVNASRRGNSSRSQSGINALVWDCRESWKKAVIRLQRPSPDQKSPFVHPFQDLWDFSKPVAEQPDEDLLASVMPELALAGENLHRRVFERECDAELKKLSATLRSLLGSARQNIAITSSEFFLPWSMLYTHPVANETLDSEGKNWKKEGFWGYQHTIWYNPGSIDVKFVIAPDGNLLSVNFDDRLATALKLPIITQHVDDIVALVAEGTIQRKRKTELHRALADNRDTLERILYFYCHGHGAEADAGPDLEKPHLVLSDGESVCADDFLDGADGKLPTNPLIFINACQGGQMTSMFYKTFAAALLNLGAVGLVGAQIDIPAVFEVEYGKRILSQFPSRQGSRTRLGRIMSEANRAFFDQHNNPLGFVYSHYYGANCFIDRTAVSKAIATHA